MVSLRGHHESGELTGYINGKEIAKTVIATKFSQGAGPLYVGDSPSWVAAKFVMDDLAIYNRGLTAEEVVKVMGGALLSVSPKERLATTWATLKR